MGQKTDGIAAYENEARALGDEIRALRERASDLFLKGLDLQAEAVETWETGRAYRATEGVRRAHSALHLATDVIGDV